jgi:uncharacterized protein YcbK (DUF882 family)
VWAAQKKPKKLVRELAFNHLHTGEKLRRVYWVDGRYVPGALADINYLLRDFRTGDKVAIDVSLLDLLADMRRYLDTKKPLEVISAYRSPQTNSQLAEQSGGVAKQSLHMEGKAIDVRVPGSHLSMVRKVALAMERGGVGYYPGAFVHLDVGRVRWW